MNRLTVKAANDNEGPCTKCQGLLGAAIMIMWGKDLRLWVEQSAVIAIRGSARTRRNEQHVLVLEAAKSAWFPTACDHHLPSEQGQGPVIHVVACKYVRERGCPLGENLRSGRDVRITLASDMMWAM